ncbi:CDP-alcohol phosphatidyltransferase family protein [Pseudofulvibacter geojedonensis]|uniref:CDP-alcohol phosphatidyltransferase family protein n=1 Tax=Pseudofulvibacter geojedonensis TaxID=1123758 RepID=A0ABW3HYF5_9FLAO
MKKHIPNLITLLNLFCGCIAVLYAVTGDMFNTALFVVLGIVFDFFDGFAARMLKVQSELGLQLDSLADMVTSGVVPGIVMYKLLGNSIVEENNVWLDSLNLSDESKGLICFSGESYITFIGLLVTLASCYRLAKFNLDTRQTDSFIGVPTPANTLLVLSLPLIIMTNDIEWINNLILNKWFLIGFTLLSCYLLNAEIPLFALKLKTFGFKENAVKYLFLLASLLLIVFLHFLAIPIIIALYIIVSLVLNARDS